MTEEELTENREALKRILETQGIRNALVFLNHLTNHRFTSLYRFDDETLKSRIFYDRLNPRQEECPDIPLETSYCIFLKQTGEAFLTEDSLSDERVVDHPKRRAVQSYYGVPLVTSTGEMFGSLCHFDFEPRPLEPAAAELLDTLAYLLAEHRIVDNL